MFPRAISDALKKHCGNALRDFVRAAVAEKISRDFGENLSPALTRGEQGRRTDLERLREQISAARAAEKAAYERFCLAAEKALKPRRKRGDKAAGK